MKKFNDYLLEQVESDRSLLVVDNLHGYARIQYRLANYWNAICLLGENNLDKESILSLLVGIASMVQHTAESVGLVEQQDTHDKEIESIRGDAQETKWALKNLLLTINQQSKQITALQLGVKRYSFEFDERQFHELLDMSEKE